MPKLSVDLKRGEAVRIGDTVITLEEKRGQRSRITIQAPASVKIERVSEQKAQECHISQPVRGDTHVSDAHSVR